MARHQTGDKPWYDSTFIKFRNAIWHHQTSDVLVQSDVKCKTFNFHFNLSKFIICVFLSVTFILRNQQHSCWCLDDAGGQVISSYGIGRILMEYSGFSTRGVDCYFSFYIQCVWKCVFVYCEQMPLPQLIAHIDAWLWTINATPLQCRSTAWTSVWAAPPCML